MHAELTPWLFEGVHLCRSIDDGDESRFVGADVCQVLEIKKAHQALSRLDTDERSTCIVGTPGGPQEMIVVSEAGIYRLVFSSRKPVAERFKRWLAHEVIPAIRKQGCYGSATQECATQSLARPFPDWPLEEMRTKGSTVDRYRMTYGISAARWVMPQLGFPPPPPELIDPLPPRQHAFDYPAGPPGGH